MKIRRAIRTILLILVLCSTILFNSCSDDSVTSAPPPAATENLILLDTAYAIGARALVYCYVEETLKVGYNNIYIVLTDSVTQATITDAHIRFNSINHGDSTAVENPPELAVDGLLRRKLIN